MNRKRVIITELLLLGLSIYTSFYLRTWKCNLEYTSIQPVVLAIFFLYSSFVLIKGAIKSEGFLVVFTFCMLGLYILSLFILPKFIFNN